MADDLIARAKNVLNSEEARAQARAILRHPVKSPTLTGSSTPRGTASPAQCLLLDISGSMAAEIEPGVSAWKALGNLSARFPGVWRIAFNNASFVVSGQLPPPGGGTNMAEAFRHAKRSGVRSAILITDGLPDSPADALREASGLRLDILYVGPEPRPPFLDHLARQSGGTIQRASLKSTATPALTVKVRQLLALPAPGETR